MKNQINLVKWLWLAVPLMAIACGRDDYKDPALDIQKQTQTESEKTEAEVLKLAAQEEEARLAAIEAEKQQWLENKAKFLSIMDSVEEDLNKIKSESSLIWEDVQNTLVYTNILRSFDMAKNSTAGKYSINNFNRGKESAATFYNEKVADSAAANAVKSLVDGASNKYDESVSGGKLLVENTKNNYDKMNLAIVDQMEAINLIKYTQPAVKYSKVAGKAVSNFSSNHIGVHINDAALNIVQKAKSLTSEVNNVIADLTIDVSNKTGETKTYQVNQNAAFSSDNNFCALSKVDGKSNNKFMTINLRADNNAVQLVMPYIFINKKGLRDVAPIQLNALDLSSQRIQSRAVEGITTKTSTSAAAVSNYFDKELSEIYADQVADTTYMILDTFVLINSTDKDGNDIKITGRIRCPYAINN